MPENSVTSWIALLKGGDQVAAKLIWDRFFQRLSNFARAKLGPDSRRAQDEEDLAVSAIHALYLGAREQRFRQFENRDDLWQLLTLIVARKASNVRRRLNVRPEIGECDLGRPDELLNLDQLFAGVPSPELLDSLDLQCDELLSQLSEKLKQVALLKLRGHTNEEIAQLRGRSVSTIERYLQMIRSIWSEGSTAEDFC